MQKGFLASDEIGRAPDDRPAEPKRGLCAMLPCVKMLKEWECVSLAYCLEHPVGAGTAGVGRLLSQNFSGGGTVGVS